MASASIPSVAVVNIRGQHVVIENRTPETGGQSHTISYIHGSFSLFFDPNSNTAFSRLRLSAIPEEDISVYLHIHAEHISSIVLDRTNFHNPELARLCGSSARGSVALRLMLNAPGTIIGPSEWPLHNGKAKQEALDKIQFVAAQKNVVFHLPEGVITEPQVQSLCLACSSGLLSSSVSHANIERLYKGRGGKTIPLLEAASYKVESPAVCPPAYDKVAGPPRSDELHTAPQKRRRESSGTPTASATPEPEAQPKAIAVMEESEHLRDQMRSYIQELCNESMAQREKRLWESVTEREVSFRREVLAELENVETRIKSAVAAQVEHLASDITDEVMDRMHEEIAEVVSRDEVEEMIDDKVTGIKIDVEDFCKDEMLVAQDRILDHFENGMFISRYRRSDE